MSCIIKRIIQFNEPIRYNPIVIMYNDIDVTNTCMFSWSSDTLCWTNWTNYDNFTMIGPNLESDFYLRILIATNFNKIYYNGAITSCYSISLYNENPFLVQFCDNVNLFNPYMNLDCALLLQHYDMRDKYMRHALSTLK